MSDYDAADEIQSACACVEDDHQAYVKITFQPSSLTDYAAAEHIRNWDYIVEATYFPEWWDFTISIACATTRAELWRQARVFTKGSTQVCPAQSQGHTYFVFGGAEVESFSHCVVHAYGESKVMAGKWCQVYAHDCSTVAAADNSYVELREGSILNGRMNMCSSGYGEYQGFSFGHVYGGGLTRVLDNSYVAVIRCYRKRPVHCHKGSIIIDENLDIKNQTYLLGHAQKNSTPKNLTFLKKSDILYTQDEERNLIPSFRHLQI